MQYGTNGPMYNCRVQCESSARITRGAGGYWSYLGTDILSIPKLIRLQMNLEGFSSMATPNPEFIRVVETRNGPYSWISA